MTDLCELHLNPTRIRKEYLEASFTPPPQAKWSSAKGPLCFVRPYGHDNWLKKDGLLVNSISVEW
jgi:hypothetical protein